MKKHMTICDGCKAERPTNIDVHDDTYAGWSEMSIKSVVGLAKDMRSFDLCGDCTDKVRPASFTARVEDWGGK